MATLNKGLNFCITNVKPEFYLNCFSKEVDAFTRTLQIRHIFRDETNNKAKPFTGNPSWKPPTDKRNKTLDGYSQFLNTEINNIVTTNKIKHNISIAERKALASLRKDENILIQKADKGGSIVVLNTSQYRDKMYTMLADPVTYTSVPCVDLTKAETEIFNIVSYLCDHNFISNKQKIHLTSFEPKTPILYGLPKIHKPNWPLRPIVSQIDSPAYKLNKYLDCLLTAAEKNIPNLLQDTTRFLQIINSLPLTRPQTILFTIDVTSLYTVLPHDMVIEYCEEMYGETLFEFKKYCPDLKPIPGETLKQIIHVILSQTFFSFDNKHYIQNYGITMGAPSSVKLANITLHKHLTKIARNYIKTGPSIQLRLIDDIFGIWNDSEAELLEWVKYLNDSHPSIKFTIEHSTTHIPFLDTLVYLEDNKLKTKLYKKPTDNKQYLHFNSEHPQHVKKAIPYAQALRYRRIIEDDEILDTELCKLASSFILRAYPENIVHNAINKARNLNRSELIQYRNKTNNNWNYIPFVLTFNNALVTNKNNSIHKLITESWTNLLSSDPNLSHLQIPKIVFRKCTAINNLLVSTQFPPKRWSLLPSRPTLSVNNSQTTFYCTKCAHIRCKTCNVLTNCSNFKSSAYNTVFPLRNNFTCTTRNIIYVITCTKCFIQYVGETNNSARERISGHRSCIKLNKPTPVGIHFNSINHSISDFSFTPIELLPTDNVNIRRTRESFWQFKLGTIFPKGLNAFPITNNV
jgi:hypothetical protein